MVNNLPPSAVPSWMHKLKNGVYVSKKILERCLLSFMSEDEANQTVEYAIGMGVLVPKAKVARTKAKQVSLCFEQNQNRLEKNLTYDPYCFECHSLGEEPLTKCLLCLRSFHVACQRKNPHRPNYSVPSDKGQSYRFPLNESDMEQSNEEEVAELGTSTPALTSTMEPDSHYELDCNSNINIGPSDTFKHETESSDDVYFVSETPARQRRRCSTYVKREEAPHSEPTNDLELCTPCRLLKLPDLLNPPHMSTEELNCLLGYSWQKHHTWLSMDVRKYMAKHWNEQDSTLVKSALFKNSMLGLADITHNIELNKFHHLSEFLIDLLDLQHNIGVFFGTQSDEYNATKWLLRDITHDIREISRCSDCYRHSNESNRSALWFAKPCTQRHELVYAKQHGFRHWPAKVIRVMTKKSSIYDVRFFGGSHSRALILARDILPIDTDVSLLNNKIKVSRTFNAAMRELRCHMILLHQPMYLFSFNANHREAENLINRALLHCMEAAEVSASINGPRAATPSSARKRKAAADAATTTSKHVRRFSATLRAEALQDITSHMTGNAAPSPTLDSPSVVAGSRDLMQEVVVLNDELTRTKAELHVMREELKATKCKKWCQHCFKEAKFDCCFTASYCSSNCKRRHKRVHQATCSLRLKT